MMSNIKKLTRIGLFVLLGMLTSCVTKVNSLKVDKDQALTAEEGYLLIAVETNFDLEMIQIGGEKNIGLTQDDLQKGSNYILINLPAGDYQIEKVRTFNRTYFELDEDELWDFSVKPGVISYVGHLDVRSNYWGYSAFFELMNKSSSALEYLEDKFPTLLITRRVEYGGTGEDRFFELVRNSNKKNNKKD